MFAVSRIFTSSDSRIGRSGKRRIVGVEVATSKKSIGVLFFQGIRSVRIGCSRRATTRPTIAASRWPTNSEAPLPSSSDCMSGIAISKPPEVCGSNANRGDLFRNLVGDSDARRIILAIALAPAWNHPRAALFQHPGQKRQIRLLEHERNGRCPRPS